MKNWIKENWLGIIGYFILMAMGIIGFAIFWAGFCVLFGCGDSFCFKEICY